MDPAKSIQRRAQSHTNSGSKPDFLPWYVGGFLLAGLAVTLAAYLPAGILRLVSAATNQLALPTNLLIGTSMAAIGLQVDFTLLRKHGPKLMLIAGSAWLLLFVAVFALCLIWK
ncbi:MAG TPA: putative sulfate exporter family transporter [Chthoniobacterales bacterium]|nr:putative sulfate exporter family transporter [Chthoniobacterales bacterium]